MRQIRRNWVCFNKTADDFLAFYVITRWILFKMSYDSENLKEISWKPFYLYNNDYFLYSIAYRHTHIHIYKHKDYIQTRIFCIKRKTAVKKVKFKKSDDQTNIEICRETANITEYHIISKLIFLRTIISKFMKIRQL